MRRLAGGGLMVCLLAAGCNTAGGVYNKNDPSQKFSAGRTAAAVLGTAAVAALAVAAARNGGGGYYPQRDYSFAWDYQPLNGQWVCRGQQTGQYAEYWHCQYLAMVDTAWPD